MTVVNTTSNKSISENSKAISEIHEVKSIVRTVVRMPVSPDKRSIDDTLILHTLVLGKNSNSSKQHNQNNIPSKVPVAPLPFELKPEPATYLVTLTKPDVTWDKVDYNLVDVLAQKIGGENGRDDARTYLSIVAQILKNYVMRLGESYKSTQLTMAHVCQFVWGHVESVEFTNFRSTSLLSGSVEFNFALEYK